MASDYPPTPPDQEQATDTTSDYPTASAPTPPKDQTPPATPSAPAQSSSTPAGSPSTPADSDRPPTPATPPVTTGSLPAPETTVKRAEPVEKKTYTEDDILRMHQEMLEQQKKEWADYQKMQAPLYRRVQQMLTEKPPDIPQPQQTPPPPSQQENMNGLKKSALGYLAVALPLAALMGAKGGWAFAGAWGGFGKGLTALTEGNQQAADEAFHHWMEIDRIASQKWDQQMEVYKAQLANRNMTTQQMMDMINFNAKQFGDRRVEEQTEMNSWQGMLDVLAKKDEAKRKYDQFIFDRAVKLETLKGIGRSQAAKDYEALINNQAWIELGHGMDAAHPKSEEERQLLKKYPLDKYWKVNPKPTPSAPGAPQSEPVGPFGQEQSEDQKTHQEQAIKDIFGDEPTE